VAGTAIRNPAPRAGAGDAALGGDHELIGIRIESFRDEALTDLGPVRVGRIDQVDAKVESPAQDAPALVKVCGFAPDARARETHRAEAQAVDRQVAAQGDDSG